MAKKKARKSSGFKKVGKKSFSAIRRTGGVKKKSFPFLKKTKKAKTSYSKPSGGGGGNSNKSAEELEYEIALVKSEIDVLTDEINASLNNLGATLIGGNTAQPLSISQMHQKEKKRNDALNKYNTLLGQLQKKRATPAAQSYNTTSYDAGYYAPTSGYNAYDMNNYGYGNYNNNNMDYGQYNYDNAANYGGGGDYMGL